MTANSFQHLTLDKRRSMFRLWEMRVALLHKSC